MTFTVFGEARPKGSMRAIVPKGSRRAIVTDSNRSVKAWQQLVAIGAGEAITRTPRAPLLFHGPVRVVIGFYFPRPKKYTTKRTRPAHMVKPDVDKLARAVLDALTTIVFRSDAQVAELIAAKHYADSGAPARCDVTIEPMPAFTV